jgi:hypothetical protein
MQHERLTLVLMTLWGITFSKVIEAATLQEFMGGYDADLLQWSACIALMGGGLRTIFSLQSDARLLRQIAPEALWDAGKALVSGMVVFLAIQALGSLGWAVPSEVRFGGVLAAGVFRFTALQWLGQWALQWLNARGAQIVGKPVQEPKDKP